MTGTKRKPWILLVEDNQDDIDLALRALERCAASHDVVVASDGVAALEQLFDSRTRELDQLSLVLLDLKLPGLSGFEVLQRVRQEHLTRETPVVVLSSSSLPSDVNTSYGLGASDYVSKPVSYGDFLAAVEEICRRWLPVHELSEDREEP